MAERGGFRGGFGSGERGGKFFYVFAILKKNIAIMSSSIFKFTDISFHRYTASSI